jgi:hypothetical protein
MKEDAPMHGFTWQGLPIGVHADPQDDLRGPEDLAHGIWGLVQCSDGRYYGSREDDRYVYAIEPTAACAEMLTRRTMATMGARILYGECATGEVIRIVKFGRRFAVRDLRYLQEIGVRRVWAAWVFAPEYWAIDGRLERVQREIDLDPAQTAKHAVVWGSALGLIPHSGLALSQEEIMGEAPAR